MGKVFTTDGDDFEGVIILMADRPLSFQKTCGGFDKDKRWFR